MPRTPGDSAPSFCDVALRLPLRQYFTYRLPASLRAAAQPGQRVLVPLRRDTVIGVLTRLHRDEPDRVVRDVIDIVDEAPWFSPDLLRLGDWLSRYYFCSPGEALGAMLPSGLGASVDTVYHHAPERVPTASLSASERKLCFYLAEHPGASRRELLTAFPQSATSRRLEKLIDQGTVSPHRRVRSHKVSAPGQRAVEWIGAADNPSRQEDALARFLSAAGAPVPASRLREMFPDAPRRLLRLSRRKLVRAVKLPQAYEPNLPRLDHEGDLCLTAAQEDALAAIRSAFGRHQTFLLHGVTGSGKTEVYIRAIKAALQEGGAALYLVPEIGLANHLLARLAPHFLTRVVLLHSGLTEKSRAHAWRAIHAGERTLVIGTRSAALAPLRDLKIVVVDEEQDPSLKQDNPAPRYHGRDVAIWRARGADAVCVLGTATPSLESWHHARSGKYRLLTLPQRIAARALPKIYLVDRKREQPARAGGLITRRLQNRITRVLEKHGQVILFLNRRGYSGALRCAACGQAYPCPDCSVAYSFHRDLRQLRCHFCGRSEAAPDACAHCGATDFLFPRAGTQKIEAELADLFPAARAARLDLDVAARRGKAVEILERFGQRELDILVGTQMITKGLHFPHVALVGILNTDLSLDMPDFRAAERTVQLVLQVAGRAGRGDLPGEVYVQTLEPEQEVYRLIAEGDYAAFATRELAARETLHYPPFRRLVAILAQADIDAAAEAGCRAVAERLAAVPGAPFRMSGPAPAALHRLRRQYRWQIILKTARVGATLECVEAALSRQVASQVRFCVDVDPVHLL